MIQSAARYLKRTEARRLLGIPLLFTEEEKLWEITDVKDTRLVLHACRIETDVAVVAEDTDVLALLVNAYAIIKPLSRWDMKIHHEKFADVGKIYDFIGETISELLLHVHAITGCDTTPFFFGVGKARILKKIIRHPAALDLLKSLGMNKELYKNAFAVCH